MQKFLPYSLTGIFIGLLTALQSCALFIDSDLSRDAGTVIDATKDAGTFKLDSGQVDSGTIDAGIMKGRLNESCLDDGACLDELFCHSDLICRAEEETDIGRLDHACLSNGMCFDDLYCHSDLICRAEEQAVDGLEGGACIDSVNDVDRCMGTLHCLSDGICHLELWPDGHTCLDERDCQSVLCLSDHICHAEKLGLGENCLINTDCGSSWICADLSGKCEEQTYIDIDSADDLSCAVRSDGQIKCWGEEELGANINSQIPNTDDFTSVAIGRRHACGLKQNGKIKCWGDSSANRTQAPEGDFVQIVAGDEFSCGLGTNMKVHCWGNVVDSLKNDALGNANVTLLNAGSNTTCALKNDEKLVCWSNTVENNMSIEINELPQELHFKDVTVGYKWACGIELDNKAKCWGEINYDGNPLSWQAVEGMSFRGIFSGWQHLCGILANDAILCHGLNLHGQNDSPDGEIYSKLSLGTNFSCGIKLSGKLDCWGRAGSRIEYPNID